MKKKTNKAPLLSRAPVKKKPGASGPARSVTGRAHFFYSGRVQGVGFRYTAERLAHESGLLGWVKNIPGGKVEIVCEGSKEKIENFQKNIKESQLGPHIKKVVCVWEKPTGEFDDFRVEFCY